jgi:hypothetical protein
MTFNQDIKLKQLLENTTNEAGKVILLTELLIILSAQVSIL